MKNASKPQTVKTDATKTEGKSTEGIANAALQAATVPSPSNGADYVPCKFTYGELQSLVIPERKSTFSPADAERFVESVIDETLRQKSSGLLDDVTAQAIIGAFDISAFAGLTPSQALATVMRTLAVVRNVAKVQNVLAQGEARALADEKPDVSQRAIKGLLQESVIAYGQVNTDTQLLPYTQALQTLVAAAKQREEMLRDLSKLSVEELQQMKVAGNTQEFAGKKAADYRTTVPRSPYSNPLQPRPADTTQTPGTTQTKAPDSGAAKLSEAKADAEKDESLLTKSAEDVTVAAGLIVGQARSSIDRLMRPPDVGCAMSILSAIETRRAYGRLVSNRYIAVQIVVRNLNEQQAFILHDAELAVNIDPNGLIGRFYSGRDKVIVREAANAQLNFDARNIVVHTAEGIGAVMGSAALVFGGALADATNVYQTGFYQSLSKSWKDMSVEQLNLLNDTGFSSQQTSQVVVPKTGSVMFVMFIPEKQFEQAWWTLPCAGRNVFGEYADLEHRELLALTKGDKVVGDREIAATGYDVQHALASCRRDPGYLKHWTYNPYFFLRNHATDSTPVKPIEPKACNVTEVAKSGDPAGAGSAPVGDLSSESKSKPTKPKSKATPKSATKPTTTVDGSAPVGTPSFEKESKPTAGKPVPPVACEKPPCKPEDKECIAAKLAAPEELTMFEPYTLHFNKWSGNTLAIFQELSTAVVAGMHIINEPALAAQLTELKCDTDTATGTIKFPVPDKGELACTATGKNLDKVGSVRLRNAKDPADAATVDGATKLSGGDNTSAAVTFNTALLYKLTSPDYTAMLVDKNGLETKTNTVLHLSQAREINTVTPNTIDANNPPKELTLAGHHLAPEKVQSLIIKTSDKTKLELRKAYAPVSTDETLNFELPDAKSKWTDLGPATATASLTLSLTDGNTQDLGDKTLDYKVPAQTDAEKAAADATAKKKTAADKKAKTPAAAPQASRTQ